VSPLAAKAPAGKVRRDSPPTVRHVFPMAGQGADPGGFLQVAAEIVYEAWLKNQRSQNKHPMKDQEA
jgi:hypothetical protein